MDDDRRKVLIKEAEKLLGSAYVPGMGGQEDSPKRRPPARSAPSARNRLPAGMTGSPGRGDAYSGPSSPGGCPILPAADAFRSARGTSPYIGSARAIGRRPKRPFHRPALKLETAAMAGESLLI